MAAVNGQMSDADSIEMATRRLLLALDALEAAAERRSEADHGEELLANQVHALGADRARLASELDEVTARVRSLETANREVMHRIDQAIETIRTVLSSDTSQADNLATDDPAEDEPTEEDDSEEEDEPADEEDPAEDDSDDE
jgi:chromosome segregation ATPase